ncbi:MAG TPA: hypothetical protein VGQ76_21655 [Thermoanaerobaculia bacterium]|jgi:hypothetical protein|nr:hypothetical protein [Thermoanaerobaculia bacterium]
MKHLAVAALLLLLVTIPVPAQDAQPAAPGPDPKIEMAANDLHAVARIVALAENLERERPLLLAILDSDIREFREPREDGTFRWASLQREEGGRVSDEKTIEHVYTQKELRYVTVTAPNGYRIEVTAPKKRSTFSANNRVYVRNVIVESTGFDGKITNQTVPLERWVNPGDSTSEPLPEIGKSVKITAELGVESGEKQAVATVTLVQAKLVDDPTSPYFPAVKRLLQLRELVAAKDINRGALKSASDEALLSLPGELTKRTAEMEETARVRKQMAESGTTTGSIAIGDATPDVVKELNEIARLMVGTVDDQTQGRERMRVLIETLTPKVVAP